MKKLFVVFAILISVFWMGNAYAVNPVFSLTTTELASGDTFQFNISAAGTFYVDCGTGGILSGNGVSGDTITKNNTSNYTYTCTYSGDTGPKTIQFDGAATGYASTTAISFSPSATKIASISGSLGQIFGTIANPTIGSGQPRFTGTFSGASNMTGTNIPDPNNPGMNYALPPTLFDGISGAPAYGMFSNTFYKCRGLNGSIPANLFGNIEGPPASYMFERTFQDCSGLTGLIPSGLFGNLYGAPAGSMFHSTFTGCSGLTGSIPSNLFGNLSGAPERYMFYNTFSGCSGLTGSIPSNLFGNISGTPAESMFSGTFSGCSGLTGSIPSNLFGNLSGAPVYAMFSSTFSGCSRLTGSIPSGLFGNISGTPASHMFAGTFYNCRGLTGSIPSNLFGNLSGAPAYGMFSNTFRDCHGLTGSIPPGLFGNLYGAPAGYMFERTFQTCIGLTGSIPSNLFGNLSGPPASNMFSYTFTSCSGLTGFGDKTYVPGAFLANINTDTSVSNQVMNMFVRTQLDNTCPSGTYTSTRAQFNGASKPWCTPEENAVGNIHAITLFNYEGSETYATIYENYDDGWYSDSGATITLNSAMVPTRSNYTFRGFYTAPQSDLTASGGDGTYLISANGTLPANTTFSADKNLYAVWARNCNPGTGCNCNLIVNNDGSVTYQTGAENGYTLDSGSGTYAPVCSPNNITLTWDGGGTPSSCIYGETFNIPTPEVRKGYVFVGWKVNTPNP